MSGWLPSLDPQSPIAIYEQIVEAVAIAVTTCRSAKPRPPLESTSCTNCPISRTPAGQRFQG